MDTTGGYQSLLGLTSINSNSSTIDVLDVENININGVIDLSQAIVGGLTTSQVDEGLNLYYTDTRVNNNSNVSSNTTHRDRTDNPHGVTATQVGIDDTDDISEGVTNLYYTDIRFDNRLATKTTTSLAEGSNLYYTDARFDTRFGIKTTTDLAEGTNLYYTDARFDTRLATKTTDNLTEATNLYYTDARFDTRFGIKTTTNLVEGTNLYYTDARFDTRLATKSTTNLTEGTNLYYTDARVSANTDVKANSDYRAVGHLPLAGGTLTGELTFEVASTSEMPALTSNTETINGVNYIASASSIRTPVETYAPWKVFNDSGEISTEECWHQVYTSPGYDNTTGLYTAGEYSTFVDGKAVGGEWVQLQKSTPSTISQFDITARLSQCAKDFTVAVSSDGTNFTAVYSTTGQTWTTYQTRTYTGITPTPGYYFRLIITAVNTFTMATLKEWRITFTDPNYIHSINNILNINGVDVNTLISDVSANTAKVSADGSINTHSDVSILEVQDQQFLKYSSFTQKWANVTPTTAMIAEHDNLYYTDARFDTRFATKTTTNLTEGTNLYYTEARFDTSFGVKKTTDLTEGINLYYTDARFDTRFGIKTTTDLTEGTNLYYTEARVSANTDVKANSDYRNTGHLPLSGGSLAGDLTWDIDIELPTWSSDTVYTPSDDPNWSISSSSFLTSAYRPFKAFNKTVIDTSDCWISASGRYNSNGTVSASTYTTTQVDGSNSYQGEWIQIRNTDKKLRLTSFILTTRLTYPEYSKYYRLLGTNDDPTVSPNWTTLMYNTTQLVWSSPGESIVLTPDGVLGYYNTYRLLITQCSVSLCSIGRFIPSFTVAEGTVIDGTSINGTDIDTLIADVSTNTAKVSYPSADATKVGFISVTQAVDLDNMESDIKANSDYRAVGHLPLAGGIMTGDIEYVSSSTFEVPLLSSNTSASPDFIASESSYLVSATLQAWKLFDSSLATTWHIDSPYDYVANTTYNGTYQTALDGGTKKGQWIQIQTASETILTQFIITPYVGWLNRSPIDFVVGISTDGTNFTTIFTKTAESWTVDGEPKTYTGITPTAGTYFRVIITKTGSTACGYAKLEMTFANKTTLLKADGGVVMTGDLNMGAFNITNVGAVDGVDLVTLENAVSANTAKVSADGSINTHSDVNITTPADGHLLTYTSGEWKNLPPSGGTYVKIDGTSTLTGNLNMGSNRIISLATPTADTDGATKKYIDDKFELYEEGKVLAERYSIATWANNTAEMDARFNGLTPNASQYLTNLYTMGWSGDYFGVIYNCYLYIPTDGNVTFRVRSDDSSDWFIDDALVASNYGGHAVGGAPVVTSTVFMTAGFHKSFSRVIEQSGGEGMIHDWDLNGGSTFTTIPTANILIPKLGLSDITDIGSGAIITTSERADIATNSDYVAVGHLPLSGGSMTGNLNMGSNRITSVATPTTAGDVIPLAAHNTYVPTIGDGTNNFTLTSATGHYTVIGNMCHVSFYVLWTSKGSASGTIRLSLPFTSATGPYSSMALSAHNGIDASLPSIGCFNLSATNYVVFFDKPVGLFAMNQTSFTNAGAICGSGFFYL